VEVTQDYRFNHNCTTRPCDLSLRVLENLKWVAFNFKRELPSYKITKIEFIKNDRLYERFQKTRDEFKRLGKSTKEMLLYHGTKAANVTRFKVYVDKLTICLGYARAVSGSAADKGIKHPTAKHG
jgi:hypothetical protein